jgi:hypothetical protein
MDERDLTDLFRRLGAREPATWAQSQRREGIPQLARFLFLRQAWKQLVGRNGPAWAQAVRAHPGPGGEATLDALDRMTALGVSEDDLTTVVRHMQRELLFAICYLLSDPGELEPEVRDMAWGFFQLDATGRPVAEIASLHESVLETDPECDRRPAD